MQTLRCAIDAEGVATITFDAPDAPVNTMTETWQREMIEVVEQLHRDKARLRGVLLASAKPTFFAGAPLKHLLTLRTEDAVEGFRGIEAIKRGYRRLETLGRPVVALLGGAALGGGWEVALAAHARFALDDERLRFGMPEVTLGLIPGASGIVKTVRLLGFVAAQPYVVEGRLFGPGRARDLGLVQGLATDADGLQALARAWIAAHPDAAQPWDRSDFRWPGGAPDSPRVAAAIAAAPAMLAARTHGRYPAPQAALEVMVESMRVDVDTALRIESRKLAKIMVGANAKAMIGAFFFDRNAVRARRGAIEGQDWHRAFAQRVSAALRAEVQAMVTEGVPALLIGHAAAAAGLVVEVPADAPASGQPAVDFTVLQQRLLDRPAVEAARAFHDGLLESAAEANLVSILVCGFPGWTGGALRYLETQGLQA